MKFENNARGLLDRMLYMSGSEISRDQIIAQLDGIASMNENDRMLALQEYYLSLYKEVYRDNLKYRDRAANDISILKEDQELGLMTAQSVFKNLSLAFDAYFAEKKIDPCEGKLHFGVKPDAIRDAVVDVCNEFKGIDTLREAGRSRKIDLLNEMSGELVKLAKGTTQYQANNPTTINSLIEEMYIMHEERAAQYAQRNWRWKVANLGEMFKTRSFLNKTKTALRQLGFDPDTHGPQVKERLSREPVAALRGQIARAEDNRALMQAQIDEAERLKRTPTLTVARDKYEKAQKYYENKRHPERTFRTRVAHILDRYNLPAEKDQELSRVDLNYKSIAELFDFYRETDQLTGHSETKFHELSKTFLEAALKKDEPVDIKQIIKDVNEYLVREFQTFSVLYERDELKDLAREGRLLKGSKLEFLKRNLPNIAKSKLNEEELERFKNDLNEVIDDMIQNRETYYAQEMEMLKELGPMEDPPTAQDLIDTFNRSNRMEIDLDGLKIEIAYAMDPSRAKDRDTLLKNIVTDNYPREANEHENKRQMNRLNLEKDPDNANLKKAEEEFYDVPKFFDEYLKIVGALAKELDPNYEAPEMFGLNVEEVLNMKMAHFDCFSYMSARKQQLNSPAALEDPKHLAEISLSDLTDDTTKIDYHTSSSQLRTRLQETYLSKRVAEEMLKGYSFIGRWYYSKEVNAIQNFIKTAETTLKNAKFDGAAAAEAMVRGGRGFASKEKPQARLHTYKAFAKTPEDKAKVAEREQEIAKAAERKATLEKLSHKKLEDQFFEIGFRPSLDWNEFNRQHTLITQIGAKYISGRTDIPKAKEVFEANFKKFKAVRKDFKNRKNAQQTTSDVRAQEKSFEKIWEEFDAKLAQTCADYKPMAYEEVKTSKEAMDRLNSKENDNQLHKQLANDSNVAKTDDRKIEIAPPVSAPPVKNIEEIKQVN